MSAGPEEPLRFQERARILGAAERVGASIGGRAGCAVILGSGFAPLLDLLEERQSVSFSDIPGLPGCSAPGHSGLVAGGRVDGRRCVMFSGRLHLYEGLRAEEVTVPVALAQALGADRIVLTCAAGGVREEPVPGSLVLVEDHINLTGTNPLLAVPLRERRPAFLPLGDAYDPAALVLAKRLSAVLPGGAVTGVLAGVPGPCYETPAEYRALGRMGADIVSMSCVLETIAARSLGMRVLALAIVANGPARLGERGASGGHVLELVKDGVLERGEFFRAVVAEFARM